MKYLVRTILTRLLLRMEARTLRLISRWAWMGMNPTTKAATIHLHLIRKGISPQTLLPVR
jgi:hypothetical protein